MAETFMTAADGRVPVITPNVYGHLIPSMQTGVGDMIDNLITPLELPSSAPNCTQFALRTQ
jgi:hypothetical protein